MARYQNHLLKGRYGPALRVSCLVGLAWVEQEGAFLRFPGEADTANVGTTTLRPVCQDAPKSGDKDPVFSSETRKGSPPSEWHCLVHD